MDIKLTKSQRYGLIIAGISVLLILAAMVRIPYSYALQGKILAGHEWLLIRQDDGSLTELTRNNLSGVIQHYRACQIDRGDIIQFRLNPGLLERAVLSPSDTIGIFSSNFVAEELARLQGELDLAYAALAVSRSGEKQSLLMEAENTYELNLEQARVQQKILERESKLFSDNLVSDQDYEITRGMARIAELEVQVAEARLQTLRTGAKPEEINFNRTQIAAIERNLATVKNRLRLSYMISPVAGVPDLDLANDTLITVTDSLRIVLVPVPAEYCSDISVGKKISVQLPDNSASLEGKIRRIGKNFRLVAAQQVLLATAELDSAAHGIPVNIIASVRVAAEPKTIWQHLGAIGEQLFF